MVLPYSLLQAGVDLGAFGGAGAAGLALTDHTTTSSFDHAFVYQSGSATDLGTLGVAHYSYGLRINNSNAIVGGSFVDASDSIYHAFLVP
jgi:uncharacterized membrane protein